MSVDDAAGKGAVQRVLRALIGGSASEFALAVIVLPGGITDQPAASPRRAVKMIQRHSSRVGGEGLVWAREVGGVTDGGRNAQFVYPAVEGRVGGWVNVVFFSPDDQIGVVGVSGSASIAVREVAGGSVLGLL